MSSPPTPNRSKFWTPAKCAEAREGALRDGVTAAGAARLGCSYGEFKRKVRAMAWPRRDLAAEQTTRAQTRQAEAKRLAGAGMSRKEIAATLGVDSHQVGHYLRGRNRDRRKGRADAGPVAPAVAAVFPRAVPRPEPQPRPVETRPVAVTRAVPVVTPEPALKRPSQWPKRLRCLGPCGRMRQATHAGDRMCGCQGRPTFAAAMVEHAVSSGRRR